MLCASSGEKNTRATTDWENLTTVQGLVTDFDENNLDLGIKQNVNTIVQKKEKKKKLKQNKAQ